MLIDTLFQGLITRRPEMTLRRARGQSDSKIQDAVDVAVRAGTSVEQTTRTLRSMGVTPEKIETYLRAAYPDAPSV
jgi:hypothetical protein